jgi:hypothetical protein
MALWYAREQRMTSTGQTLLIAVIVIAAPLVFVGFWMGVCWLLALVGGWRALAGRYRVDGEPRAPTRRTFGMLGLVSYNGVLDVAASNSGLDLRVMSLFRAGHPPLRIPWTDIRVEGETWSLFGSQTKVRLGRSIVLRVPTDVWRELSKSAQQPSVAR